MQTFGVYLTVRGTQTARPWLKTLASTGSLGWLELEDNDIGDRGAEAPAAGVGDVVGL